MWRKSWKVAVTEERTGELIRENLIGKIESEEMLKGEILRGWWHRTVKNVKAIWLWGQMNQALSCINSIYSKLTTGSELAAVAFAAGVFGSIFWCVIQFW